jgi:transcriptional regulator GlxA family with amidase domain
MTLSRVEHALEMMRIYLIERAIQTDGVADHGEELTKTIVACLRQTTDDAHRKEPQRDSRLAPDVLRHAIRFVNDNLGSKLKWDEIAAVVGVDPFTFGRCFKVSTAMTPHQYIIRCRLRRAMKLLAREDLTLADIALEVGCSCQSHLTTLFRKHLGTTPGAFRASSRQGQHRVPQFATATTDEAPKQMAMRGPRRAFASARVEA